MRAPFTALFTAFVTGLFLSLAAVLLSSGTLSTAGIVQTQDTFANWNIVATGIVPFVIFLIAVTAELNRPPFDLVEAEQELVSGFNTEYGGISFALFFIAEFMKTMPQGDDFQIHTAFSQRLHHFSSRGIGDDCAAIRLRLQQSLKCQLLENLPNGTAADAELSG